jgi:hypothetical protein
VAAQKELTRANDPKYIYLTGDDPGAPTAATAGGVNMDNPGGDQARKDAITHGNPPFNVNSGKIYLIVNYNSLMTGKDAHNWPPAKVATFFDHTANPLDPTQALNTEFTNLRNRTPAPEGLVISADPYFRLWRTAFTAALGNILPVPVCYPFQDFIDAINNQAGQPNINNSLALDKPKLNNAANYGDPDTAYFRLGARAATFLATNANVGIVKWTGSTNGGARRVTPGLRNKFRHVQHKHSPSPKGLTEHRKPSRLHCAPT